MLALCGGAVYMFRDISDEDVVWVELDYKLQYNQCCKLYPLHVIFRVAWGSFASVFHCIG